VIPNTRYCALGWLADDSGFYYTRYPAPGSVPAGQENYNSHVFFHRLGTDPKDDPKVFGEGRRPEEIIRIDLSPDGRWLTAIVMDGWTRSDLLLRDLSRPDSAFVPVAQGLDAIFEGGVVDGVLYIRTNLGAPRYRLVAADPAKPDRAGWKELIPESEAVLDDAQIIGGRIVTRTMVNAFVARRGARARRQAAPGGDANRGSARWTAWAATFTATKHSSPMPRSPSRR